MREDLMARSVLLGALLFAMLPGSAGAQGEGPASVTVAGATPKAVGEVLKRELASQKFKVGVSDRRILLTQDRGRVPQATGDIVRVRLEVGIRVDKSPEGLMLTVVDETLIGDRGAGLEQRRTLSPERNRTTYLNLLTRVKAELEGSGANPDSTVVVDSVPGAAP
jgi:hypothetical protein